MQKQHLRALGELKREIIIKFTQEAWGYPKSKIMSVKF